MDRCRKLLSRAHLILVGLLFHVATRVSFFGSDHYRAPPQPSKNETVVFDLSSKNHSVQVVHVSDCYWWNDTNTGLVEWGDEGTFSKHLKDARDHAHELFSGKSFLVLGGSTSRDLAADFMQMVLPRKPRETIKQQWEKDNLQGFMLLTAIGKQETTFSRMYRPQVMAPLMEAGWNFSLLVNASHLGLGCRDCTSRYTNVDYVAEWGGGARAGGITYENSWKPEIFTAGADVEGFRERYCRGKYDVVHLGKGLHDAAFKPAANLTREAVRERFLHLAKLLECLSDTTMIILRTPYVTTNRRNPNEIVAAKTISSVLRDLAAEGAFGSERVILIDGHMMTKARNHPFPFDGHHYQSLVARSYWSILFYAAREFFATQAASSPWPASLQGKWQRCGLGIAGRKDFVNTQPWG